MTKLTDCYDSYIIGKSELNNWEETIIDQSKMRKCTTRKAIKFLGLEDIGILEQLKIYPESNKFFGDKFPQPLKKARSK